MVQAFHHSIKTKAVNGCCITPFIIKILAENIRLAEYSKIVFNLKYWAYIGGFF